MCGIFVEFSKCVIKSESGSHQTALNIINHRGPDNRAFYADDNTFLGHTRLSILGLESSSNQPFEFENFIVVFNGEIFNFKELRSDLSKKGFVFNTGSDTEVLIKAYKHWGDSCFNMFNGMWSIVIYDKNEDKILVSRDRFGQKPLFYLKNENSLYISSEFEPLTIFSKKQIDYSVVKNYLKEGGYDSDGHTFFKDIKEFPKSHFATIHRNLCFSLERYWSYPDNKPIKWIDDKKFEKKLSDAVSLRLRSDVPIAVLLSGGVDSTIISAICSKNYENDLNPEAFTFSSKDEEDESIFASEVAKKLSMKLNTVSQIINYKDFRSNLSDMVQRMGRCHSSPAIMNVDQLYKAAKSKCYKVVLDGQGADELLAGYKHYHPILLLKYIKRLDFKNILNVLKDWNKRGFVTITIEFLRLTMPTPLKKIGRFFYGYEKFFTQKRFSQNSHLFKENKQIFKNQDSFNKYLINQHNIGLLNLLYYGDIIAMQSSIENRSPFLDHKLIEYVFKMDFSIKVQGEYEKYALRNMDIYKEFESQLNRPKIGFSSYINNEIKLNMIEEIQKSNIIDWPIFSSTLKDGLKKEMFKENKYERLLFRLFQVHLWHELFCLEK